MTRTFTKVLFFSLAATALAFTLAAPAQAATGREAVNACIDYGPKCGWNVNDKGEVDVCTANGCWTCKSANDQCVKANRRAPQTTRNVLQTRQTLTVQRRR